MPKMPDSSALSSPGSLRSGRDYLTAGDVDFSAVGKGVASLGQGISQAAGNFKAREEKQKNEDNALDLIRAENAQRQSLFDSERALDEDGDYPSHDRRYTESAVAGTNKAAELIRDPALREKWRLKADGDILTGRGRVGQRADAFAKQDRYVKLEETLESQLKSYTDPIATDEERAVIGRQMEDAIELGKRSGMLPPKAAKDLHDKYVRGAVKQDAERMLNDSPDQLRKQLLGDAAPQGELEPSTIDLGSRTATRNSDGSFSTVKSMSIEQDGRHILIPTIVEGKEVSEQEAIQRYLESNEHLGVFDTEEHATAFAKKLSKLQEKRFMPAKGGSPEGISVRLETGKTDPMQGVKNISGDSKGSKSYGNFGLNSMGSAQKFVKEYGSALGLSGKPGTEEFDRSWKAVANADPEGLHQAEMAWYQKEVLAPTAEDLTGAGVSEELASDPRVIAYFADRKVQQGPGSIDDVAKHASRIKAAADKAGGSVEKFLNQMTEADRSALEEDFPSALRTGVYSAKGHDNRLYGRLNMALAMGSEGPVEPQAGRFSALTPLERSELLTKAERSNRQRFEGQREILKQGLDDDVESIRRTGVSSNPDLEMSRRVLEPNQVNRYFINREEARLEYEATNDLPTLTNEQLTKRLDSIAPAPGEAFYEAKRKVFDKAEAISDKLIEARDIDPARSVEQVPEVKAASAMAASRPGDPAAIQELARARIDAQAKVGVPESRRSPITKAEARVIMAPVRGLENAALREALVGVREQLETQYGPYARAAGISAIQMMVQNRDLAEDMERSVNNAFNGLPTKAADQRRIEHLAESGQVERALGAFGMPGMGSGPQLGDDTPQITAPDDPFTYFGRRPSYGAIEDLRRNPALAGEFNRHYGAGLAETILATPPELELPTR